MKKGLFASLIALLSASLVTLCATQKTGKLKGKIETEKAKPIAGAQVRVMSSRTRSTRETTTDDAGNYSFDLEPDDYTLSFDAEGFRGGTLREMQQVEEGKDTQVKTIRLGKAKHSSLVRGAVFDSNGASLSGVAVKLVRIPTDEEQKKDSRIDSLSRDYTTNNHGEFAFRLPSMRARYRLTATLSGYKQETKTVDVGEDEAVPVAFSLEPLKKQL